MNGPCHHDLHTNTIQRTSQVYRYFKFTSCEIIQKRHSYFGEPVSSWKECYCFCFNNINNAWAKLVCLNIDSRILNLLAMWEKSLRFKRQKVVHMWNEELILTYLIYRIASWTELFNKMPSTLFSWFYESKYETPHSQSYRILKLQDHSNFPLNPSG